MSRPRMIDTDGVLICTADMYPAWSNSPNLETYEIEFSEEDTKDVIDFLFNSGFDILLFNIDG
jgi:hypothetical protein